MSKHAGPTEAGSGGKLGHRSMDHRTYNSEIKHAAKKKRRQQDRVRVEAQCEQTNNKKENTGAK